MGLNKREAGFNLAFWFSVIYIAAFCWLSQYAWPQADDYAFSTTKDVLHSALTWTLGANGRLIQPFFILPLAQIPSKFYWLLPLATLLTYLATVAFLIKTLAPENKHSLAATLLFTAATLASLYSLNETLYWLAGEPYVWCTSFLLVELALAVRAIRDNSSASFWACLVLVFLNGTMLEPASVFEGVAAFATAVYFYINRDKQAANKCMAFWLAAVAAFLVLWLSPGTAKRMSGMANMSFMSHLARTLAVMGLFGSISIARFFIKPLVWAFLLFVPALSRGCNGARLNLKLKLWQVMIAVALIAPLMHGLTGWGNGSGLPARGESTTVCFMAFAWCLLWVFVGEVNYSGKLIKYRWLILIACLIFNSNTLDLIRAVKTAPVYYSECVARHESILNQKAAGVQNVDAAIIKTRPSLLFYDDIRPWPSDWRNKAVADYYGVGSVADKSFNLSPSDGGAGLDKISLALLGELYDPVFADVDGIAKDPAAAIAWYEKAAHVGNAQAARSLARLLVAYEHDYIKAARYLILAQILSTRI